MNICETGNEILLTGFAAAFTAQLMKFLIHIVTKKNIDLTLFTTSGGMPSSHSAGVMGVSTAVGLICGFDSVIFAVSLCFALIVMYDAAGVRRAAGKQAACLNKIIADLYKQDLAEAGGKLKELLGHTPMQVFAGALYGVLLAFYIHNILG